MGSRRPSLLLVGDTLQLGGTEGQFTELACRLDRSRWNLEVACLRPEGPLLQPLEAAGVRPFRCGPPSLKSPLVLRSIVTLARHMRAKKIEILHSFDFYSNTLALPAARLAGVRAVVGSQRDLGNLRSRAQQKVQGLALRLAKDILVNSEAAKQQIVDSYGIQAARVTVVPNGIDISRFSPGPAKPPAEGLVVGTMSNLRPEKGLADLVRAMSLVHERGPKVRLVIHGEGTMRKPLEALVASLNLAPWVSLPGSTARPEDALRNLDVFALPSVSESCSNGLMEAMATALPVIATAVGGNPGLVEHEVTGLLVPPNDPSSLAQAILRLAGDRTLSTRLGEQARAQAHQVFGMDRMVARMEELYTRSLNGA